jgi:cytosine/adenosine deaminase-related metal-dependent hydrolase
MQLNAGTLVTVDDDRSVREEVHVVVDDGEIVGIEDGFASGDGVVDASDEVVIPGLVNCHTHMYALPIRGAPLTAQPESFYEALVDVWWEVDEAFTERDARLSALGSCAEMLEGGVTTFCDNYSGPNTLPGALDAVAAGVSRTPIRGMLTFETTARNSEAEAEAGLDENRRFLREAEQDHERVTGHYCLHTLFTNTESVVRECAGRARDDGRPVQLHLEEGLVDVHRSIEEYGERPVFALEEMGLLDAEVIAAHCVHSTEAELEVLADHDVRVAHNPYSNTNNAVGIADVETMQEEGMSIGLGDDGWDPDMLGDAHRRRRPQAETARPKRVRHGDGPRVGNPRVRSGPGDGRRGRQHRTRQTRRLRDPGPRTEPGPPRERAILRRERCRPGRRDPDHRRW